MLIKWNLFVVVVTLAAFVSPVSGGSTATDLGTLGGDFSEAHAINDRGQIVGFSETSSPSVVHAFLWEAGTMTDLGSLFGGFSRADGMNHRGQVVGRSGSGDTIHAFLWEAGVMTDLGTLGGEASQAADINNRGHVVGVSETNAFT